MLKIWFHFIAKITIMIRKHKNEVIVCNSELESDIVKNVIRNPPSCWGNIPLYVVICSDYLLPADLTGGTEIQLKSDRSGRKGKYKDDQTLGETRYIMFERFMYYWLEERV